MDLIELTNGHVWDQKFWLRVDFVVALIPTQGNMCEIRLTTGEYILSLESAETVSRMIRNLSKKEEDKGDSQ